MKRMMSAMATVAALFATQTAAADEYTILILPDAYFPEVTYLEEGDTVRFINVSGSAHSIIAKNGSWELGPLNNEQEVTMVIDAGAQKTFYNKESEGEAGTYSVEGRITFSAPPSN